MKNNFNSEVYFHIKLWNKKNTLMKNFIIFISSFIFLINTDVKAFVIPALVSDK